MLYGQVLDHQATVEVRLRGADGAELVVKAVLDTGYTGYLILPIDKAQQMGWERAGNFPAILADNSEAWVPEYRGTIFWNGAWRRIPVRAMGSEPLLGMALLQDHDVHMEVVQDGIVIIESREEKR